MPVEEQQGGGRITPGRITPRSRGNTPGRRSPFHLSKGQHTPKLKLKLKFDVSGHNSVISCRNCFFLGLLERGYQARSEELKKLANCAALQCKMCVLNF
eukprot:sb/3478755/